MSRKQHWESVYESKRDAEVSWTQAEPRLSLALIREVCPPGRVIDVGGGTSVLAERLLDCGYAVAVLDISPAALARAKLRLGPRAEEIRFIVADVTATPDLGTFDVWHDRAVFHFLTEPADRAAYVALLLRTIPAGGDAVIATFAPDGPEKCSGLPVQRYDSQSLAAELGDGFDLLKGVSETHLTPWGKPQAFAYSVLKRVW
jgi:SAM-dependent methyltransferase